jgi:hypothetical protein
MRYPFAVTSFFCVSLCVPVQTPTGFYKQM